MNFKFPLLRLNAKHVQRLDFPSQLRVESDFFLERGAYAPGTYLLMADGRRCEVIGVTRLRPSYSWKYWGAKDRAWVIALLIGSSQQLTLEQTREWVKERVLKEGWESQGGQTAAQFATYLDGASSLSELIEKISFYGKW